MLSPMGTFDTALMEALLSVGISPERARAVVESFDRSIDERYSLHSQVLATKRDVAELETRLTRDLAEIETRLTREVGACSERIAAADARTGEMYANLSARIADSKTDTLKWMLAALTAQTALLAAIAKLL